MTQDTVEPERLDEGKDTGKMGQTSRTEFVDIDRSPKKPGAAKRADSHQEEGRLHRDPHQDRALKLQGDMEKLEQQAAPEIKGTEIKKKFLNAHVVEKLNFF